MHEAAETTAADDVAVGRSLGLDRFGRLKRESMVRRKNPAATPAEARKPYPYTPEDAAKQYLWSGLFSREANRSSKRLARQRSPFASKLLASRALRVGGLRARART